jgi:hypothetical protein
MKPKLLERAKTRKAKKHNLIQKERRLEAKKRFNIFAWLLKHPKKEQK